MMRLVLTTIVVIGSHAANTISLDTASGESQDREMTLAQSMKALFHDSETPTTPPSPKSKRKSQKHIDDLMGALATSESDHEEEEVKEKEHKHETDKAEEEEVKETEHLHEVDKAEDPLSAVDEVVSKSESEKEAPPPQKLRTPVPSLKPTSIPVQHKEPPPQEPPTTQRLRATAKASAAPARAAPASKDEADALAHWSKVTDELATEPKELATEPKVLASSAKPDVKAMEKSITEMMMGGGTEGLSATPFGKSVGTIKDLIQNDMMVKVVKAHQENQAELYKLVGELHSCEKTKTEQVVKANVKKKMYEDTSALHKTCREGESADHMAKIDCLNEQKDKKDVMDLKCKDFAMTGKRVGDQKSNSEIVKKGGGEATETYVRRLTATICGKYHTDPKHMGAGGGGVNGFLDHYMKAKFRCEQATHEFREHRKKCNTLSKEYAEKKATCDSLQDQMDGASCKRAIGMKDACETYAECFFDRRKSYDTTEKMVRIEESDRKTEWRGLKRMDCLMVAFADGKVKASEVTTCKNQKHTYTHLDIDYPKVPPLVDCNVPHLYPSTPEYKLREFAPLPALAKGKADANECTGVIPVPTKPKKGSPKGCTCQRATLNGPYSAGPLVVCNKCAQVRRSMDVNSCPDGTKLFSPRSAEDWKTIFSSVGELPAPYWIVDITRPANGNGGTNDTAMNSEGGTEETPQTWKTSDGSPWWLRDRPSELGQPNGNYHSNCYLAITKPYGDVSDIRFNADECKHHATSYYCQLKHQDIKPKRGSPAACECKDVVLTGPYSAGALIKCTGCLPVSRSTQKNSCPLGTKIFSPAGSQDWKTFLGSAQPLRSPNWIIDVTRPQNGCGGCNKHAMNSKSPPQMTWRTSDGSPWWLRSNKYSEPTADYQANCYMDLFQPPANENAVMFRNKKCRYFSNAYYCQPVKKEGDMQANMQDAGDTDDSVDADGELSGEEPVYTPGQAMLQQNGSLLQYPLGGALLQRNGSQGLQFNGTKF